MITSFDCSFENAQGNLADSKRWATKPIGATGSLHHLNSVARFLPPSRKYKHLEETKLCRHVGGALPRVSTNSGLSKIYQGALGGTNSCSTHPPQGALLTLPFLQGPCYRHTPPALQRTFWQSSVCSCWRTAGAGSCCGRWDTLHSTPLQQNNHPCARYQAAWRKNNPTKLPQKSQPSYLL